MKFLTHTLFILFCSFGAFSQSKKLIIENLNKSYDSLIKIEKNLKEDLAKAKLDFNNAELTLKIIKEEKEKENEKLRVSNKELFDIIKDKEITIYQKDIELLKLQNNMNVASNHIEIIDSKNSKKVDLKTLTFESLMNFEKVDAIIDDLNKNTDLTFYKHKDQNYFVFQKTINNNIMVNGTLESDCENCYKLIVNYYTQDKILFYQFLSEGCNANGLKYLDLKYNLTSDDFKDVILIETNSLTDLNKGKIADLEKMKNNIFNNFDLNYMKLSSIPEVFECTDFLYLIGK